MTGIPKKRIWLYAGAVGVLLSANALRWLDTTTPENVSAADNDLIPVAPIPKLDVARELEATATSPGRDIFQRPVSGAIAVLPPAPAPPRSTTPAADPLRAAKEAARRQFDSMALLGVLRAGDDLQVMLQFEDEIQLLKVGQDVLPGFIIEEINTETARIYHQRLALSAIVPMAGTGEVVIYGMDE